MLGDDFFKGLRSLLFGRLLARSGDLPEDVKSWGEKIDWKTLEAGQVNAALERKPLMLIVYFPGCPVCGALKKSIATSEEVAVLSASFAMSLINELDVPQLKMYYPDNLGYVPRVIFFDHRGKSMPQFFNQLGNPTRKYFYANAWSLFKTMLEVKDAHDNDNLPGNIE